MSKFEPGQDVWMTNGQRAEYMALVDGKHLVRPMLRGHDYYADDGEADYDFPSDDIVACEKVFASAPIALVDESIARAKQELSELLDRQRTIYADLQNAKARNKELSDLLTQNVALERMADFIKGRFKFFLVDRSFSDPRIEPINAALAQDDRFERDQKLLTLFGKTNGDLQWRINKYSDGSGGWDDIYPCEDEEQAKVVAQRVYDAEVAEWRSRPDDRKHYGKALSWPKALAFLVVPDDIKQHIENMKAQAKSKRIADLEKQLAEARAA